MADAPALRLPAREVEQLVRQGMTLIADHVESEAQVVDLLDYDVHFAQGFLFSAPVDNAVLARMLARERAAAVG